MSSATNNNTPANQATWRVVHLKPRTEKKVAEYCRLYNITHYLPLRLSSRVVQRRKVQVKLPVFPGYIFVKVNRDERLMLLKTNLTVRFIDPITPRQLLRDLVMVRRALRGNPELKASEPLEKGRLVRIISGPFNGVEGLVTRMAGKMKVVLNVEMIGHAVTVTAERHEVKPL